MSDFVRAQFAARGLTLVPSVLRQPGLMQNRYFGAAVLVLVVFLLRLPFLTCPVQGDDVYYLYGAMHAQIDPLHPHGTHYAFLGSMVDMRGHTHPPLNAAILGLALWAFGDVREVPFHLVYLVLSWIAVLSGYSLCRRFCSHPLPAALLFAVVPVFIVNATSLEADLPFLAFSLLAITWFARATDRRETLWTAWTILALTAASLIAYQAVLLIPVLAYYLWFKNRDWKAGWLVLLTPVLVIIGWQFFEKWTRGEFPIAVTLHYMREYRLQAKPAKLKNLAILIAHLGWLVFPVTVFFAFRKSSRWLWVLPGVAAGIYAWLDPSPLAWVPGATGISILAVCAGEMAKPSDEKSRFLAGWILLFFLGSVTVFFAGSARYLLPLALPLAMMVSERLWPYRPWVGISIALSAAIGMGLAVANLEHWRQYQRLVQRIAPQMEKAERTWVNAEWGLEYYSEAEGALPLLRSTRLQPGDLVIESKLGGFTTSALDAPHVVLERTLIQPKMPLRIFGLGCHSGYSSTIGYRVFEVGHCLVDEVTVSRIAERKPVLSYFRMGQAGEADSLVQGLYQVEPGAWRWTSGSAMVAVRTPQCPCVAQAEFTVPEAAKATSVEIWVDGVKAGFIGITNPGQYVLNAPVKPEGATTMIELKVSPTFRAPGDDRDLGVILTSIGLKGR